jgi:hypothetical protein
MHCRKIFGASGDAPSSFSQPALAGFVFLDTDFSRNGSEWRIVNANGDWQLATGG